jgi:hypothetical protein
MIKVGDMLKHVKSEKVFRVRSVSSSIIIVATRDGNHSMFVNPSSIEFEFLPCVEDEAKTNPT